MKGQIMKVYAMCFFHKNLDYYPQNFNRKLQFMRANKTFVVSLSIILIQSCMNYAC